MDDKVQLIIPLTTVQAIVSYLQNRPFVEVFELIASVSELPRFQEAPKPSEEPREAVR
jgi:hypothetical protein